MAGTAAASVGVIDPDCTYTRYGFKRGTSLCDSKLREAKRLGIECRRIWIGKRCFYKGSDIQTFLEEFAAASLRKDTVHLVESEQGATS